MAKQIERLNSALIDGRIALEEYEVKARSLLVGLDWQARIKWVNKLLVTV